MQTILVCHENLDTKELIKELLSHEEYNFIFTETPELAIQLLHDNQIQCIISELKLKNNTSENFMQEVALFNRFTPFLFIAAYLPDAKSDEMEHLKRFPCSFIKSPLQQTELITAIKSLTSEIAA